MQDGNGGYEVSEHVAEVKDPDQTVALKDGGKTIYIRVKDEKLLSQLKNMDEVPPGDLVKAALWANRKMAYMYTALSPVFVVTNGLV